MFTLKRFNKGGWGQTVRFHLTFFGILAISLAGCCRDMIIPERDMEVILTKVFLTDALVASPQFGRMLYNKDTIDYYSNIYESMGYTRMQFDSTLKYYSRNPEILNRVMDKVVSSLSQMESEVSTGSNTPGSTPGSNKGKEQRELVR